MSADKYVERAVAQSGVYVFSFCRTCGACEQFDIQANLGGHGRKSFVMLSGQNLGRSHQAALEAIVHSHKHGHEGYNGLTAADIALNQAVHLATCIYVGTYFLYDTLLGIGERKRQTSVVEVVKPIGYTSESVSFGIVMPEPSAPDNVELDIEQFVELEPIAGFFE